MKLLVPLALVVALAASGSASHCSTWSTSDPTLSGAGYYYAIDFGPGGWPISNWVYEESNGLDGLQRGDEVADDTCHGMIESDTVIF